MARSVEEILSRLVTRTAVPCLSPVELDFARSEVPGDGNCFWHSLVRCGAARLSLHASEEHFVELARQLRCEVWRELGGPEKRLKEIYLAFVQESEDGDPATYLDRLERGKIWAGELEIEAASKVTRSAVLVIDAVDFSSSSAGTGQRVEWQALCYGREFAGERMLMVQRRGRHFTPLFSRGDRAR